jgi:hypothetical protein
VPSPVASLSALSALFLCACELAASFDREKIPPPQAQLPDIPSPDGMGEPTPPDMAEDAGLDGSVPSLDGGSDAGSDAGQLGDAGEGGVSDAAVDAGDGGHDDAGADAGGAGDGGSDAGDAGP